MREFRVPRITALLVGVLVIAHDPARGALLTVLTFPLAVVKAGARLLVALPRLPSLAQENATLREELMQRQAESAHLRELVRQSQQTEALLAQGGRADAVVARVIGRSTIPTQHTVLLNRGAHDGLTLDSVIVDAAGVIGRVMEVHDRTCLVMLLTDPESRVAGLIERSRETGLLVGQGSGRCAFIYLNADADVEVGDRILTAGLGGPFPKGVLLGTVERVTRDTLSGSASAIAVPAARLNRAEEVLCLPPSR